MLILGCSEKKIETPEDIGNQVLDILHDLDELSESEYLTHFITADQLHSIARDTNLVKQQAGKIALLSVTQESMKTRNIGDFKMLKQVGKTLKIDWKNIRSLRFEFQTDRFNKGARFCFGTLTFEHKGKKYSVSTTSIFNGEEYLLTSISNLGRAEKLW